MKGQLRISVIGNKTVVESSEGERYVIDHREGPKVLTVDITNYAEQDVNSPDADRPDAPWQPLVPATLKAGARSHLAKTLRSDERDMEVFKNNLYTVIRTRIRANEQEEDSPDLIHLSIRRNDRSPARDWRHFQKIKNDLVGPHAEGVELFPDEDRLVDTSNQYHLWCVPEDMGGFNFGWFDGRITTSKPPMGVQRPFVDGEEETLERLQATLEKAMAKADVTSEDLAADNSSPSPQEDE